MAKQAKRKKTSSEPAWFGFQRMAPEDKTGRVRDIFSSVASRYDLMNDVMSGGLHRLWKDRLVRMMNPKPGEAILDVAGGTGDIALRCYRRTQGKANITVCDLNPDMLEQGRAKAVDQGVLSGITFITGNAEKLPIPSRSANVYVIAFGLRNVGRINKALEEAVRVLKPGGRFFCLEFSPGVRREIKPLYDRYSNLLPWLGQFIARDRDAYQYLADSIRTFPDQKTLVKKMEAAGLEQVKYTNLMGGIAVIHSGWKL
ncbi:MAG: class I SAM-dependent methyltransferase [Alphaproteobacteria bacterium]|nr:class I SAM-dependent methyltransferase [Alphaproteobacteria bacterium]